MNLLTEKLSAEQLQANEGPNDESRRKFLKLMGKAAAVFVGVKVAEAVSPLSAVFAGENSDEKWIDNALAINKYPQKLSKTETGREETRATREYNLRKANWTQHIYNDETFPNPHGKLITEDVTHNAPWFTSLNPSNLECGDFDGGYFNEGKIVGFNDEKFEALTNKPIPKELRELGLKVNLYDLAKLLYKRYDEILKNPREKLAKNIDPSRDDFLEITQSCADVTGFPADVIRTMWWRESLGNGAWGDKLHGGFTIHRDGPLAIFTGLFKVLANYTNYTDYNGHKSESSEAKTEVFAMPADYRLPEYRETNDILMTHVPKDMVSWDPELNILAGLMIYYQSLVNIIKDDLIKDIFQKWVVLSEEYSSNSGWWGFAYSIYHHGGVSFQQAIGGGKHKNIVNFFTVGDYILKPLNLFVNTLKSKSWDDPTFIGPSHHKGDAGLDLEFFYMPNYKAANFNLPKNFNIPQ